MGHFKVHTPTKGHDHGMVRALDYHPKAVLCMGVRLTILYGTGPQT